MPMASLALGHIACTAQNAYYRRRDRAWSECLPVGQTTQLCKNAEPIKMPFAVWTLGGPRNHESDGGPRYTTGRETFTGTYLDMSEIDIVNVIYKVTAHAMWLSANSTVIT